MKFKNVLGGIVLAAAVLAAVGCSEEKPPPEAPAVRQAGDGASIGGTGPSELTTSPAEAPAAAGMKKLQVALPKPAFIGTPKNIPPGTTVERPTGKPRPPLDVPEGVDLLSKGRKVVLSDAEPIIGSAELVTDGDKEAGDGRYVEMGPGVQHVQIDLGAACEVHAVAIWQYHGDPRVCRDVIVKTAADPDFIEDVRTLFNNDHDNSAGEGLGEDREYFETNEGKLIAAPAVKARYVRVYANGSTAEETNRFTEVEVYGLRPSP